MDWNWFFGAFAQSMAAIIGIMYVFIISKHLNNELLYKQKCIAGSKLIWKSRKLTRQADSIRFSFFIDYSIAHYQETPYWIEKEKKLEIDGPSQTGGKLNFEEIFNESVEYLPPNYPKNVAFKDSSIQINKTVPEIEEHINEIKEFIEVNKTNPENSKTISFMIWFSLVSLILLVLYPLHFLPVNNRPLLTIHPFLNRAS